MKKEKGILTLPPRKTGRLLSQETQTAVHQFYQDDMYSRCLPGKKDYVSVNGVHMQKQLILCNLNELYVEFKSNYPNLKVGFSKFCTLKPKWCVYAGASGIHSVCVCTHHQNSILLVNAIKWDYTYT